MGWELANQEAQNKLFTLIHNNTNHLKLGSYKLDIYDRL